MPRENYKNWLFGVSSKNKCQYQEITEFGKEPFFILFSFKAGVTYDVLGFIFDIDGSSAIRIQNEGLRMLRGILKSMKLYPARKFDTVKDFKNWMKGEKELIIDGQEQAIQRSDNQEVQKKDYSGKKNDIL